MPEDENQIRSERFLGLWAIPGILLLVGIVAVFVAMLTTHREAVAMSENLRDIKPGEDLPKPPPPPGLPRGEIVREKLQPGPKGELTPGPGKPADIAGSWPCFRGPQHDNISREEIPLASSWPDGPPRIVWKLPMGDGHAGPAVHNGRVYVLDYERLETDDRRRADEGWDTLRCLSLADGQEIWSYRYPVAVKNNHGMSRTTPAVTDQYVVTVGPQGHVTCLDARTGAFNWSTDLVEKYGTKIPEWYCAQHPWVEGGELILAPAGDEVLLMAVELHSGYISRKVPNLKQWDMTHIALGRMNWKGRDLWLYGGMSGVGGFDTETFDGVWINSEWQPKYAWCAVPLSADNEHIMLCSGYGYGARILRLSGDAKNVEATTARTLSDDQFGSEQQTPVIYKGHIYGVRPRGDLVCMRADGTIAWATDRPVRFNKGYGPWLIADDKLYIVDSRDGTLTAIDPTPEGYRELGQTQLFERRRHLEACGPMAVAGGFLLARSIDELICADLRKK